MLHPNQRKVVSMKNKDLVAVLALLRRVRNMPDLRPVQRKDLLKAERELKKLARSGKLDKRQLFWTTRLISEALVEAHEDVPVAASKR